MKLTAYILGAMACLLPLPAMAVTDKDMDRARTIAAKAYLRYANDGSGYLDEINVSTMSELTSKLKAKEKENLKVFNSVQVPGDYASWDKRKLVEFWGVTFFTSPALDAKGKAGRTRARRQLEAMTVSEVAQTPAADETPAAKETPAGVAETPEEVVPPAASPVAEDAVKAEEEILADQNAITKDAEEAAPARREESSNTWVYVLVLAILVAVVVWLVVYAANLMKRQPTGEEGEGYGEGDDGDLRRQTRAAIAKKNEEVEDLHRRLQAEEERNAQIGMELERLKLDRTRLEDTVTKLREENNSLRHREERGEAADTPAPRPAREAKPATAAPKRRETETPEHEEKILKVIYLGRVNARGIFVRADRRINPGNTIYRLDTNDGLVGTFHVVDEPEVIETALSAPEEYLAHGCTGENLEDTAGVDRILTESSGTAIFENGYWKVLRKTRIRYE